MGNEEFNMDTESNLRMLEIAKHISDWALLLGTIPCSQKGESYYNCKLGALVNPHNYGCSSITCYYG